VAGVLNSVKGVHIYVLCSEKLNYVDYIEKFIAGKEHSESIALSFEARHFPEVLSELILALSILKKIFLSSLAFGIVCINKRVTYITNEVLRSNMTVCLNVKILNCYYLKTWLAANFTRGTVQCIVKRTCPFYLLHCKKKSHNLFRESQCHCKICVKDGPANLESLCVNKLGIYSPSNQTICLKPNCAFRNLRVFNHTVRKLLSVTEPQAAN